MTWNVLITSSPFADPIVRKGAREILGGAEFSISHSPRYGPLSEAEALPLLDGVDAVFAGVDKYSAAARAIADCHAGRRPQWVLNPEVFDSPALRMKLARFSQ